MNTGASRVRMSAQTDGSRRKQAQVCTRRFEDTEQRKSCRDGWAEGSLHAMTDVKWHAVKRTTRGGSTAINASFNQTLMIC